MLRFVRDYLSDTGGSPSYGEIAAHFRCSRERVRKTVKVLVGRGELLQGKGPRTLSLPSLRNEALRLLEEQGWRIDPEERVVSPPGATPVTLPPLLPPAVLDYPAPVGSRERSGDGKSQGKGAESGKGKGMAAAPGSDRRQIRRKTP